MRERVLDDVAVPCSGATADTSSGNAYSCGIAGLAANAYDTLIQIAFLHRNHFQLQHLPKEQAMSRQQYSLSKQLVVATTLALGASGVALADDSSMSRLGGDSYAYFNQPVLRNAAASPTWRQSHPNGLTELELQALSSSGLSAFTSELNPPVLASAPADPSWRQSHPNGLSERELQALSSSSLAMWQSPNGSGVATNQSNVAQSPNKETFSARLASFFRGGIQAGTNE
jgi:hypothetical protein